jgi:hypothetical protein
MGIYDRAARMRAHAEPLAVIGRLATLAGMEWQYVDWAPSQTTPKPKERDQTADHVVILQ